MALIDKLVAIGDAIRAKTGVTDVLTLDQMAAAIGELSTGGNNGTDYGKLLYELPEPMTFDGVDDYLETGVQLFSQKREISLLIDFISEDEAGMLIHCMHETSPYYGMHVMNSLYSTAQPAWAITWYGKVGYAKIDPASGDRCRLVITGNISPSHQIYAGNVTGSYTSVSTGYVSSSYNSFNTIEETVLLGAQRLTTGELGHFWKGTVYDFKILGRTLGSYERQAYLETGSLFF